MLDSFQIGQIAQAAKSTKNIAEIARLTGFDRRTINSYISKAFVPGSKPRKAPPRIAKRRRALAKLAHKVSKKGSRVWPTYGSCSRLRTALHSQTGELVSRRQIARDLHAIGLKPYVRPNVPTRAAPDLRKRRDFAKRARQLSPAELRKIVFSDESWISCIERTGKTQWAKKKHDVCPMEKKARWNVPSIMIWGAVGHNFKSKLVIFPSKMTKEGELKQFRLDAASYVRRCLSTVVKDLVSQQRIFQQDGARSHAAKSTLAYLKSKFVRLLEDYPAYSPDLNAIERIWNVVLDRVGQLCPLTQDELIACTLKVWDEVPQSLINKHCAHFGTQIRNM